MKKLICLSGGMDSAVILYNMTRDDDAEIFTITFNYGQAHYIETIAAKRLAGFFDIPNKLIDFEPVVGRGGNLLMGGDGSPVVPNRNATMLSLAVTYAEAIGAEEVYFGPTKDDFELFPDCRPKFVNAFNAMLKAGGSKVRVIAPLIKMTKPEVADWGDLLGVPFHETWSCYVGGNDPCGKCMACNARKEALACIK